MARKRRSAHNGLAEYVIRPRVIVSRKTVEQMLRQSRSAEPTVALRNLMREESPTAQRARTRSLKRV
jgi:hypothetical protein